MIDGSGGTGAADEAQTAKGTRGGRIDEDHARVLREVDGTGRGLEGGALHSGGGTAVVGLRQRERAEDISGGRGLAIGYLVPKSGD